MTVNKTTNTKLREAIETKLKENGGYCPCRATKTKDTKCICKDFREKMSEGKDCTCHCGLYEMKFD